MKYIGKLYGRTGGKFFDTGKTSADYDALQAANELLRSELDVEVGVSEIYRIETLDLMVRLAAAGRTISEMAQERGE